MTTPTPDSGSGSAPSITFDLDRPQTFGTSGDEFRIWVDVIYDWFGATLERPLRRYLVSAFIAVALFTCGLLLTLPFGLASHYLSLATPAAYLLCFDAAYSLHAFRWLSQSYHERANMLRPCFPIPDDKYREVVTGLARKSTQAWRIFLPAAVATVVVWGYFAAVTFGPTNDMLSKIYPNAVPHTWDQQPTQSLSTMILVDLFAGVFILIACTALHNTVTLIRLMQALDDLPVTPLPSLVSDRAGGILDLSLAGAVLFGGGVVLVQLLYGAQTNGVGIAFVLIAVVQGTLVYVVPRRSVNRIWNKAHEGLLEVALRQYYGGGTEEDPAHKLAELSDVLHSEAAQGSGSFTLTSILGLFSGQLLALLPVVLHALNFQQYVPQAVQFLQPK
jgi:hypothetical protein